MVVLGHGPNAHVGGVGHPDGRKSPRDKLLSHVPRERTFVVSPSMSLPRSCPRCTGAGNHGLAARGSRRVGKSVRSQWLQLREGQSEPRLAHKIHQHWPASPIIAGNLRAGDGSPGWVRSLFSPPPSSPACDRVSKLLQLFSPQPLCSAKPVS